MKNFKIYRSSAGSGKTYTLTREYLKLALRHPDYYKLILAVTFTNKATEEMKGRIVDSLHLLSSGTHPMSLELADSLQVDGKELQKRSKEVLTRILHNYSAFAVTTIDAFFQKVVRSFAREVGIQGGFDVELNQQKVLDEVVDKTISEVSENTTLVEWLIQFAVYKIGEGQSWEIRRDIKRLSQELFKEIFIGHRDEIFDRIKDPEFLPGFLSDLSSIKADFEESLASLGQRAVELWQNFNLEPNDFTRKMTGPAGYLHKMSIGEVGPPNSYVMSALEHGQWASKTSDRQDDISAAVTSGLQQILQEVVDYWKENHEDYYTAIQLIKYLYTVGVLGEISRQLNDFRDEHDLLLISDFPVFLNEILGGGDTHYIYEKIGAKYRHYLIDEFQDTSGLQWENFRPLVRDSIASGEFSMVVGDIKQSIYRWRGGNWKLLLEKIQSDIGHEYTGIENLELNWRSKRNIIGFNNSFFEHAPGSVSEFLRSEADMSFNEFENIQRAYEDAKQQIVNVEEDMEGVVSIALLEKEEASSFVNQAIDNLIEKIEHLQDANYDLRDMAILVRRKDEGRLVSDALRERQQANGSKYRYDVVSGESLYLRNSPAVHFLLEALKTIRDPGLPIHKSALLHAFHTHLHQEEVGDSSALDEQYLDPFQEIEKNLEFLRSLGIVDLVEDLIRRFALHNFSGEVAYILGFQDAVLDYSRSENLGIEGFLTWWDQNADRAIQISEDQEAIRLMTIHKAKGLQFKVVLIPFCHWNMDHNPLHENVLWCASDDQVPFSEFPYLPLRYKRAMHDTIFRQQYWNEKARAYMDNLNLLYVAFTRAEEVLHICSEQPSGKSKKLQRVSDLLSDYTKWDQLEDQQFSLIGQEYRKGEMGVYSVYEKNEMEEVTLDEYISQPWMSRNDLRIRNNPMWSGEEIASRISRGTVVHQILSQIEYYDGLEVAMARAIKEFGLEEVEENEISAELNALFNHEPVMSWFTKKWNVRTEAAIIQEDGKLLRPDRVLINDDRAIVIDFKTGAKSSSHKNQVSGYKKALSRMGFDEVEGYLLYISDAEVVQV